MKPREQKLLVVLVIVIIAVGYAVLPLRAHLRSIDDARGRTEFVRAEMEGLELPDVALPDLDQLSDELRALGEEHDEIVGRLDRLGGNLFQEWKRGSFEAINLQVSSLALEWGVDVLENAPLSDFEVTDFVRRRNLNSDGGVSLIPGDPEVRPFRRLKIEASFPAFRGFVEAFARINPRIVIAGFEIENDMRNEDSQLKVELTWVLI